MCYRIRYICTFLALELKFKCMCICVSARQCSLQKALSFNPYFLYHPYSVSLFKYQMSLSISRPRTAAAYCFTKVFSLVKIKFLSESSTNVVTTSSSVITGRNTSPGLFLWCKSGRCWYRVKTGEVLPLPAQGAEIPAIIRASTRSPFCQIPEKCTWPITVALKAAKQGEHKALGRKRRKLYQHKWHCYIYRVWAGRVMGMVTLPEWGQWERQCLSCKEATACEQQLELTVPCSRTWPSWRLLH